MSLFSFFRNLQPKVVSDTPLFETAEIDLASFRVGATMLDELPSEEDFFAPMLARQDVVKCEEHGLELNTTAGKLSCAFITLEYFSGTLLKDGVQLDLSPETTPEEVLALFGEPYWTDRRDGEVILFYEYDGGRVELQFEFPDCIHLGYITLLTDGVLSTEEQRKSYGVDKPWPPC